MSCIQELEAGICLVFWFSNAKKVYFVVRDETQASAKECLASFGQEEMSEDQSAEHLQGRNSTSGIPIFVCPMVVIEGNLVGTTRCALLLDSPPSGCALASRCGVVRARVSLRMVKQMEQQLCKGSDKFARPP
jgi:hypothetical protein